MLNTAIITKEVTEEVEKGGVRINGIVWAASIEAFLDRLLKKYFPENAMQRISCAHLCDNIQKKSSLCYSVGLISDELYHDIDILRQIRNICAHNICLDDDKLKKIEKLEKNTTFSRQVFGGIDREPLERRIFFTFIVIMIALIKKTNRISNVEMCQCEIRDLGFEDIDFDNINQFVDLD